MNCSQYTEAIQELAEGTLGPIRRAELQTHLDTCDACRALAADLKKIHDAAGSLGAIKPPDHVWLRIAGKLREENRVVARPIGRGRSMAVLAIAASLVLAVGAALFMLRTAGPADLQTGAADARTGSPATAPASAGNAAPADTVQSITEKLQAAESSYQSAIQELETAMQKDDTTITPEIAEVLKRNLPVIDQAIAESRSALQAEPQSAPARASLFGALRQKVTLLQETIALMNEMRKGNSAGAAQLVESGSKS